MLRYFTCVYAKILAEYSTTLGGWDALVKLSARPWFERVWNLQEITLTLRVLMTCAGSLP